MPPAQQRRHSARVLTSAWALRTALTEAVPGANGERAMIITTTTQPLTCRLHLHHRWRWLSTEDGGRYERCERCGKDRSEKVGGGPQAAIRSSRIAAGPQVRGR